MGSVASGSSLRVCFVAGVLAHASSSTRAARGRGEVGRAAARATRVQGAAHSTASSARRRHIVLSQQYVFTSYCCTGTSRWRRSTPATATSRPRTRIALREPGTTSQVSTISFYVVCMYVSDDVV